MSKYNKLAQNTAIFALGNVLSKLILSLLLPLYTRALTTAEYGTAELITSYSQLIVPIASLSIGDALFRYTMDKSQDRRHVLVNSCIVLCFGTILLFILVPLFGAIKTIGEWGVYLVLICVFSMWRSTFSLYSKAIGKSAIFAIDNILFNIILTLANVILLIWGHLGIQGYFYAQIIAYIFSIVFLLFTNNLVGFIRREYSSKGLLKAMIIYSAPLILNSISWGIMGTADRVMLTAMINESANGIYAAAAKIPSLLSLITGVFTQAWALSAIQDYEEEKDNRFYENVFKFTHIGVTIGTVFLLICNSLIFPWLLGKEFLESVKYVPTLLMGTVFLTYSNYFSPLFSAIKNTKVIMYSAIVGTFANILLNFYLIPEIGIMGACIATAASYLVITIFRYLAARRLFKLNYEMKKILVIEFLLFVSSYLDTIENEIYFIVNGIIVILLLVMYWNEIKLVYCKTVNKFFNNRFI